MYVCVDRLSATSNKLPFAAIAHIHEKELTFVDTIVSEKYIPVQNSTQ